MLDTYKESLDSEGDIVRATLEKWLNCGLKKNLEI